MTTPASLRVASIPADLPFLMVLAERILQHSGGFSSNLATWRIFLPTRRACRGLRDTFLKLSHGQPVLLPRLQPIGDVDAEELDLSLSGYGIDTAFIPPAISSMERQFLLARQIYAKDPSVSFDQALALAQSLAHFIDQVHTEDLHFSNLANLVPDDLSSHWQQTLSFLDIITSFWPTILAERGMIDPADRRNRLIKTLTAFWTAHPPTTPVWAAGSTGSIPTTAHFLKTVAAAPKGQLVLPGIDHLLDEDSWAHIDETHPQNTMKTLLGHLGIERKNVEIWADKPSSARLRLASALMKPASCFDAHGLTKDQLDESLRHVELLEATTAREEAMAISIALREIYEDPTTTAALITPDRELARRVSSALKRWGIDVDDSAGGTLATSTSGQFFMDLLSVVEDDFSPLPLLSLVKHPLMFRPDHFPLGRFEIDLLRGPRPARGVEGLWARLAASSPKEDDPIVLFLTHLGDVFGDVIPLRQGAHSVSTYCEALVQAAERLSLPDGALWRQNESHALSLLLQNLRAFGHLLPEMRFNEFASVFRQVLNGETLRTPSGLNPRIVILGQMEARLIREDVVLLSGLNEGTWPKDGGHDPWMSRPMRREFGLPSPERSTGLSAHDFVAGLCADRVIISRSLRHDSAQTVPSRWLERLSAMHRATERPSHWRFSRYLSLARVIDRPLNPAPVPVPPAPVPPFSSRPRRLSVTWIEKLMNNPYRVYAEKILRLKVLDDLDEDLSASDRGTFLHDVLEAFVRRCPDRLPDDAKEIFLELAHEALTRLERLSPEWTYWEPRLERIADWVVREEQNWRREARPNLSLLEGQGQITLTPPSGVPFTLTAKADRIDHLLQGGAAILDYKTGSVPTKTRVAMGLAPQLPLEAVLLRQGGFGKAQDAHILAYWKISGGATAGSVTQFTPEGKLPVSELVDAAEDGLMRLISLFDDPQTPYIAKAKPGTLYRDERAYAHLARTAEWCHEEDSDEEDSTE